MINMIQPLTNTDFVIKQLWNGIFSPCTFKPINPFYFFVSFKSYRYAIFTFQYVITLIIETGVQYCLHVIGKSYFTFSTICKFSIYHLMNSSKIHNTEIKDSYHLLKCFHVSFMSITDPCIWVMFSKRDCHNNKTTPLMYSITWVHFTKEL